MSEKRAAARCGKRLLNIEEYNKKSGKMLKYIYVVVEEFSFLNDLKEIIRDEKN